MATRVLIAAGTRPEAIKLAPLVKELGRNRDEFEIVFCATGQHRDIFEQVLQVFDLKADVNLGVMRPNQPLAGLTARLLEEMTALLTAERPDWLIVQGDTTTAMASALAAFYLRVPVAHVEAGLRTGDRFHPFPEEVNRRIADCVADLLFAPTPAAAENLRAEGVPASRVRVTGNTGIDALLHVAGLDLPSPLQSVLDALGDRRLLLVTTHRRENFGAPLRQICAAVRDIAVTRRAELGVLLPVHPNPSVQDVVRRELADLDNVILTAPLGYADFVYALKRAFVVLTDSGGIQEEAPSLGKPVLVLRENTERHEALDAGTARLVGTDAAAIVRAVTQLCEEPGAYRAMAQVSNPFGDGHACSLIADTLRRTGVTGEPRLAAAGSRS